MAGNETRGTPGIILMAFAIAALALALSAWRQSKNGMTDQVVPPTSASDTGR